MSTEFPTQDLIPTRQSLLKRLKNWDDQESWRDFFNTYWNLIYRVARKSGLGDAEAQDVVQETIFAVAKKMGGFDYDPAVGSFKGWLLQLTRWRITDHWRKKQYERDGKRHPREEPLETSVLNRHPAAPEFDLDKAWEEEWEHNLFEAALARVKTQVKPKQYQLFYLHSLKGQDARMVARKLGVKLPEVYYAKYKLSALIKKEVQDLEDSFS